MGCLPMKRSDNTVFTKRKKPRLKRCPFCKGKASVWKEDDGFYYAGCRYGFCGVSPYTSGQPTEKDAVDTWNYRPKMKRGK